MRHHQKELLNPAGEAPNAEETGPPRIEVLYFEGCPGFEKALSATEEAVALAGLSADVVPRAFVPDEDSGPPSKFASSPTILLDGEDLFPQAGGASCASCCRIYATPHGLRDHPTAAMVREALEKRSAVEKAKDHR